MDHVRHTTGSHSDYSAAHDAKRSSSKQTSSADENEFRHKEELQPKSSRGKKLAIGLGVLGGAALLGPMIMGPMMMMGGLGGGGMAGMMGLMGGMDMLGGLAGAILPMAAMMYMMKKSNQNAGGGINDMMGMGMGGGHNKYDDDYDSSSYHHANGAGHGHLDSDEIEEMPPPPRHASFRPSPHQGELDKLKLPDAETRPAKGADSELVENGRGGHWEVDHEQAKTQWDGENGERHTVFHHFATGKSYHTIEGGRDGFSAFTAKIRKAEPVAEA